MTSKIKDTEEYKQLYDKYGKRKDPKKFLSKWQDWAQYRRWQEIEGLRRTHFAS